MLYVTFSPCKVEWSQFDIDHAGHAVPGRDLGLKLKEQRRRTLHRCTVPAELHLSKTKVGLQYFKTSFRFQFVFQLSFSE